MTLTFVSITALLWFAFILYWAISAVGVKRNIKQTRSWWSFLWLRILAIVIIIWIIQVGTPVRFWATYQALPILLSPAIQIFGIILVAAGIAFAIWARRHLGKNWSGTPNMKVGHELITSGPYRFVRHPIYTGMITALLGSAIVGGPPWLIAFVIFTIVFITRIPKEEGYMMQLFPGEYPAYRAQTKTLIPFVW